jgi:hypothetical protein
LPSVKQHNRPALWREPLRFLPVGSPFALRAYRLLGRAPSLVGRPIHLFGANDLRHLGREVHAGSFLRKRSIAFNCSAREFPRICIHELFHFAWLRLGNPRRWSFEDILRSEHAAGARGELGWSAQWRKEELTAKDVRLRSRLWLEYCCESFCDTAAWMYAGIRDHHEFRLARRYRPRRRAWFLGIARLPLLI